MRDSPKKEKMVAKKKTEPKRRRGRPRGEACTKKGEGRKRKSDPSPPYKKPKIMNGDHKPFSQSNGALHPKKTLVFNHKKNSLGIPPSFHPLTQNGTSNNNLPSFKNNNKSSHKKEINSLCKKLEASSKTANNTSPLSQLSVSNELGRNLAKDIAQFCSQTKEPSKSKSTSAKPQPRGKQPHQSKESPKSAIPKESSRKDSGKPQATKDSSARSLPKEPAKSLAKREPAKSKEQPARAKAQPRKEAVVRPAKSHPQRMASLDAMARMHVICTTDRKPPEPRAASVTSLTHQKSVTHERIRFDLKKEIKGSSSIVHKREVFVSHSVEQSSSIVEQQPSKVQQQQLDTKKKPADSKSGCKKPVCPKSEKASAKQPREGDKKKTVKAVQTKKQKGDQPSKQRTKKVEQQQEVKVKETIRLQKTCTYESVTTVNSSSALQPVEEEGCCDKFHPHQIIPLAHVQTCSLFFNLTATTDFYTSSSSHHHTFSMHRFGHQAPILFTPTPTECGCCCPGPLMHLQKSLVAAYPHHHQSVCSECRQHYALPSSPRCCHHLHYVSAPPPLVPYEQSPLDLSLGSCCSRDQQQQQVLLIGCGAEGAGRKQGRVFGHGWSWKGKPREKRVALTNDSIPCSRLCYPSVEHLEGDTISERDCVLLKSGPKETDLPYVAKVAAFWENPDDGEMMMSLLWYYRPEHTEVGRQRGQMEDEVFASRHKDVNSVACIEDKCYVLTYNEYCRYKASLSRDSERVSTSSLVVPELPDGYARKNRLPCEPVSQDIVFFCRHVYDFRQKRILKNPT